jgi:hypothetical protein
MYQSIASSSETYFKTNLDRIGYFFEKGKELLKAHSSISEISEDFKLIGSEKYDENGGRDFAQIRLEKKFTLDIKNKNYEFYFCSGITSPWYLNEFFFRKIISKNEDLGKKLNLFEEKFNLENEIPFEPNNLKENLVEMILDLYSKF